MLTTFLALSNKLHTESNLRNSNTNVTQIMFSLQCLTTEQKIILGDIL